MIIIIIKCVPFISSPSLFPLFFSSHTKKKKNMISRSRLRFGFHSASPSSALASLLDLQPKLQPLSRRKTRRTSATIFADDYEDNNAATSEIKQTTSLTATTKPQAASTLELRSALAKVQRHAHELSKQEQDEDDFFVIENPMAANGQEKIVDQSQLMRDMCGNINHLPKDSVTFVADEFKRLRELEVIRRKKILAELATPNPLDYTYDGKLVPVPPLNFGQLAPQSYDLAQKMLVNPTFRKVRESPASDYFFEINDLYCEISFIGRANAGKSTLINAILNQRGLAKTSSVPHSTRNITFYQSVTEGEMRDFAAKNPNKLVKLPGGGLQFTLVDVPGFGLDGMSDKWRDNAIHLTDSYFGQRRSVNTVFMCIDAQVGVTPTDVTYFEWMTNVHGVFWILLTKCDLVPHSRICTVMNHIYTLITHRQKDDKYRKIYPFVLPVSASTGVNIDFLRALIVETSGVLPADTLRKLLQQRNGSKWFEAVRDEERRLLQHEDERRASLMSLRRELAESKGILTKTPLLTADVSEGEQEMSGSGNDDAANEDFGVFDTTFFGKNKALVKDEVEDEDDDVLSFDVPDAVKISGGATGDKEQQQQQQQQVTEHQRQVEISSDRNSLYPPVPNASENSTTRIGQFKLSAKLTGTRPDIAVIRGATSVTAKNSKNSDSDTTSSFETELAQKLMEKQRQQIVNGTTKSLRFSPSSASSEASEVKDRRNALLVEQPDGSLVSPFQQVHKKSNKSSSTAHISSQHQHHFKTRADERFEKRKQKRFERLQEDEIWQRHRRNAAEQRQHQQQQNQQNYRNQQQQHGGNEIEAIASAMREIKMTRREREAYRQRSGGTTVTGEALVDHAQKQMAVGEQRAVKTIRRAGALEFNHSGRMTVTSQPGGLWNQYGSANDGEVNSAAPAERFKNERRVLGW